MELLIVCAVEEGDHLGAGASGIGAERGSAGTLGNVVFCSPDHSIVVVSIGLHIGEVILILFVYRNFYL